jgi:hypothetical protein
MCRQCKGPGDKRKWRKIRRMNRKILARREINDYNKDLLCSLKPAEIVKPGLFCIA